MLASFDHAIILLSNQIARRSEFFDASVLFLADLPLLKGGVLAALLWAVWFHPYAKRCDHEIVIATVMGTIAALLFCKVLRHFLPFRLRPLNDPTSGFLPPYHDAQYTLWEVGSFPSDTATFAFALSTGLLFVSKRLGLLAMLYSLIVISLPRLYLGYHYSTDIIVGALIGILVAGVMQWQVIRPPLARYPVWLSEHYPSLFYSLSFLVTCEIALMFQNVRQVIHLWLTL